MIRPAALCILWGAAACASAQVTLSTVQGAVSTPAGQIVSFGSVTAGWNVSDMIFNIGYSGTASPYYLTYFNLQQGTAFSVLKTDWQILPAAIPAEGLNFTVRFEPNQVAKSDSATLMVGDASNPITVLLTGQANAGFTVSAGQQNVSAGATIAFGSVQVGSSQTVALTLANQTALPLTVGAIALQGNTFGLAGVSPAGALVPAGGSATLPLVFSPTAAGPQQGTLTIGVAVFPLAGTGLAAPPPVLPMPSIQVTPATLTSAQQGSLSVSLSPASAANGTGTVTLSFQPAVSGVADDPTVTFEDGTRSATFTVAEGASTGQFANGPSVSFGTGTTAGTLTFTVTLGGNTPAPTSITIPAAVVGIDAFVAARNVSCAPSVVYCTTTNVQLQVNGWDNARSTTQLVFEFFDSSGAAIAPGSITVEAGSAFQTYFGVSVLGGVFGLSAFFPVTGDSDDVVAAMVSIVNSAGTVQSTEITF